MKDLSFDLKDIEIFKIPDTKTRLNTLQKYFFPRLEILMDSTLELVQEIYQLNPFEDISFSYRPRHRQNSKSNVDKFGDVYLGISGKRKPGENTTIKNKNGKLYSYYFGALAFYILPKGCMSAEFFGCNFNVTQNIGFFKGLRYVFEENFRDLQSILMMNHVSCNSYFHFMDFCAWLDEDNIWSFSENGDLNIGFFSDLHYFPLDFNRGLKRLSLAFIAIYPIFNSIRCLQQGKSCDDISLAMKEMLDKYKYWCHRGGYHNAFYTEADSNNLSSVSESANFPDLDSYDFTRTGLWWDILARDNWTCCSCGRSAKLHGVTLHVDHITPRSRGGTDQIDNLQTLCAKCNIGKGNRDSTDLR